MFIFDPCDKRIADLADRLATALPDATFEDRAFLALNLATSLLTYMGLPSKQTAKIAKLFCDAHLAEHGPPGQNYSVTGIEPINKERLQ